MNLLIVTVTSLAIVVGIVYLFVKLIKYLKR